MSHSFPWIEPDWPAPPGVQARFTTRAQDMNLGLNSGAPLQVVQANRARLRTQLPQQPCWLKQVHGADVIDATLSYDAEPHADASVADQPDVVCTVLVADCLPVLLASTCGRGVGAAHAGWRGLSAGVIQSTVAALRARLPQAEFIAWLGPAIGPTVFEVGTEVRDAMREKLPQADQAFTSTGIPGKYLANLFALGRQALQQAGVMQIYGGGECTYSNPQRYYSFRRDRVTGRHAALIWREIAAR